MRFLRRHNSYILNLVACIFLTAATCAAFAQDWAKASLDKSPRHREWVSIQNGPRTVQAFVVYPEVQQKAPIIVLVHEIFGLSDWARSMADQIAAQGYIVVAPDLLSGVGPKGGGTSAFPDEDARVKAVSELDPAVVMSDLNAAADFGKRLPSANGKLAVVGFCWGGGKAFDFSTQRPDLNAAFVFYGPPPPASAMVNIKAPVYGFYGGNDARIGATVPGAIAAMKTAGKTYDPVTYEGAGHGFMRAGQAPNPTPANKKARDEAFSRLTALLEKM